MFSKLTFFVFTVMPSVTYGADEEPVEVMEGHRVVVYPEHKRANPRANPKVGTILERCTERTRCSNPLGKCWWVIPDAGAGLKFPASDDDMRVLRQ